MEKLFQTIPAEASSEAIDRMILGYFERTRATAADTGTEVAPPLESVRADLRPQLLPAEYLRDMRDAVAREFVDGLNVVYVIDEPGHYAFVRRAYLDAWAISADELDSIAINNLEHAYRGTIVRANSLRVLKSGAWATIKVPDGYASARFLVPKFRAVIRAAVGGDPYFVAFPNRNYLIAWSRDIAGVHVLTTHIREQFEGMAYPLSPTPYRVAGATVRPAAAATGGQ
ncbi:MAG: hypothetical protein IT373_07105 [Polyangiaceae bacterium]|nr:hypothetical protein [Polyangiaceae bacterium]